MFSSKGLFKDVPCPKQDDCTLPICIFAHDNISSSPANQSRLQEYDPFAAGVPSPPPTKRRKVDHESALADRPAEQVSRVPNSNPTTSISNVLQASPEGTRMTKGYAIDATAPINRTVPNQKQVLTTNTGPASVQRPISPPPVKAKPTSATTKVTEKTKAEALVPRPVPKPPEQLKKRLAILQNLHQQLVAQNRKTVAADPKWKSHVLSEPELVKFALDEEEDAARRYESDIYRNHISQQIFKVKKMAEDDWRSFITSKIRKQTTDNKSPSTSVEMSEKPTTGLASPEEEGAVLRSLRTNLVGLEGYGYVIKQPTAAEMASAKAGVEASAGWERCDRCETRFQVFPGRDSQGRLTTGGACRYHWARGGRPPPQKTDRANGRASFTYACCNKQAGSEGCTEADSHVFKVTDKKRLASIWQFEHTPENTEPKKTPVSFDCEMGYTTLGLEVIRVTAVSWPDSEELLDVLVRPYGEVLDLNTRFSGVSKKQYAQAVLYQESIADRTDEIEAVPRPLRKVESPAAARQLMFDLLTSETPLIGHAIDNDLNVVRIIHPFVIDTVLLYPHPKRLPLRMGLKALASQYLNRSIQAGDAAGHDSKEDAIATGDLVTVAVAEKWKKLKRDGWKFEDGALVAPEALKKTPASAKAAL